MRLVEFVEEDGSRDYRGTLTAPNGMEVREVMLTTSSVRHIEMRNVKGPWAMTDGMALFPRRVGGRFMMVPRELRPKCVTVDGERAAAGRSSPASVRPAAPFHYFFPAAPKARGAPRLA